MEATKQWDHTSYNNLSQNITSLISQIEMTRSSLSAEIHLQAANFSRGLHNYLTSPSSSPAHHSHSFVAVVRFVVVVVVVVVGEQLQDGVNSLSPQGGSQGEQGGQHIRPQHPLPPLGHHLHIQPNLLAVRPAGRS